MKLVRSLVITGFGINCEIEMAAAYSFAGAETKIVHLNQIFNEKVSIHDYDIINFPGGFSYGDDLGSGKVLSNKIKFKKMKSGTFFFDEIMRFLNDGKYIFGVCNGFQLLVKTGLLPNINGNFEQEVTLTFNDSGHFENRWCHCVRADKNVTPFLIDIDRIDLPIRHGEGKLIVRNEEIGSLIIENSLNCLSYCDNNGNPTDEYPLNPNGSQFACAGLTNKTGQIFGMMPHPEAFIAIYNHPNWPRFITDSNTTDEMGAGLTLFKNIVTYIQKRSMSQ